jgi:hypothetical protein
MVFSEIITLPREEGRKRNLCDKEGRYCIMKYTPYDVLFSEVKTWWGKLLTVRFWNVIFLVDKGRTKGTQWAASNK